MEIILESNSLSPEEFLYLRKSVGWNGDIKQIEKSLEHGLLTIKAVIDGETIGMGRLVGDRFMYWYVQDVIIAPAFQGKGIGKAIMKKLTDYIKKNSLSGTTVTVGLFAANGKEDFYQKLGYRTRPNEKEGAGMQINIKVE